MKIKRRGLDKLSDREFSMLATRFPPIEIAAKYNITQQTVYRHLVKRGKIPLKREKITIKMEFLKYFFTASEKEIKKSSIAIDSWMYSPQRVSIRSIRNETITKKIIFIKEPTVILPHEKDFGKDW